MEITLAGERVRLLSERALYWPRMRSLIVADLHFGKADVFRARGIPVPRGSTGQTLARLSAALNRVQQIEALPAAQIFVLGDFFHAKESMNAQTHAALHDWRSQWPAPEITIIEGNHDRHAGTIALQADTALRFQIVPEPHIVAPFAFAHHPPVQSEASPHFSLCGHIHPCAMLRSSVDRMRVPAFVFEAGHGILPAFGAFTGGHLISPRPGRRVYACVGEKVLQIPAAQI